MVFFACACARHEIKTAKQMSSDINSFRALAYVVAEKSGIKWANNVVIVIKQPDMLRLDALERISDIAATLYAKGGEGYLKISSEGKKYPLKKSLVILPRVGEIPLTTNELADILIGRPSVENGLKEITDPFRNSYFIKGDADELEMSSKENLPLVYTRYLSESKKSILYEAAFDDFKVYGGRKFPGHIVLRFENPKLLMEIKYKDIKN